VASRSPTPRPGRSLGVVALVVVGLYLGVFLGPQHAPQLGLDLRGGTSAVLTATVPHGQVTKSQLQETANIITARVNGSGVTSATVTTQGNSDIKIEVPGTGREALINSLEKVAQLRFRLVLEFAAGSVTAPAPVPSLKAVPTKSPAKKKAGAAIVTLPTASPTARSSPSPKPAATPAAATPSPTASPSGIPSAAQFTPNSPLSQVAFNQLDCAKDPDPIFPPNLNNPPPDLPSDWILACDSSHTIKYLLGPATVEGSMISSASAGLDQQGTGQWVVNLNFNGQGTGLWANLTGQAFKLPSPQAAACLPPTGCNEIAVVLDGVVDSAPTVNQGAITSGQTIISGTFTETDAKLLANELSYGALPVHLSKATIETVSPTLGSAQLRGGLIAGAIGLGLVVVYSLVYYRGLGFVTVASLALSAVLLYALVTVLGDTIGYTLTLAGIAGFIVAVGITADSFVVFFERLRDSVREGRTLRSAVEFAWPRARRTILSADTVSLLAAIVLYLWSVSDVRGFAFTLGLSTICDLFIVFLFTKPMLTFLVRTRLFRSGGAFSGLGAARMGTAHEEERRLPPTGRPAAPRGRG